MTDDKITDKIHALLNMTEANGCTEAEAATALVHAQALLLKHNLVRADIMNTEAGTPTGIGKLTINEPTGFTWKRTLASVLANANLCKVIGSPTDKDWHIFGSYDNVKSVVEMYQWVTLQLVFMANRDYRAYKNDEGTERAQVWKAGYYMGATKAIKDRLTAPMEAFSNGTGRDLVIRNTAELTIAVRKVFPRLVAGSRHSTTGKDGHSSGLTAGKDMTLTPAKRLGSTMLLS